MINVSKAFKRSLYEGNNQFLIRLIITLQDGTRLEVKNDNIMSSKGILIDDAVSEDDDFTALGSTIINACDVILYNNTNLYSNYEFINAKALVYIGLNVNGTVEEFKKGTYTVDDATYSDSTVSLSLVDEMAQFDRPYSESKLKYPATLNDIVLNACSICNVPLANNSLKFPHRDFSVAIKPSEESTTFREVIGWAATIAGCFARCNVDGELELKWFDTNALDLEQEATYDGGTFNPWTAGNIVNGGTFNPWSTGTVVDGGEFTDSRTVHYISSLYSQSLGVDDVVITGVKIIVELDDVDTDESTKEFTHGTDDYLIEVSDNKFITVDNAPTILNWLATLLIGLRFRKCNIRHLTDPTIEAGDVALLWDTKDVEHRILITRVDFSPISLQTIVSGAAAVGRNSAIRFSSQTKSYVATRRQLRKQQDSYEQALEQLAEKVTNANGLYETDVEQQDGSIIKYYHNKAELGDSDIQIVISDVGITVTSNGTDKTPVWYGLTVDGTLIASIMNTIGINFDWGVGGELIIKKGDTETLYVNASTGEVRIVANTFSLSDGSTINSIAENTLTTNFTPQNIFNKLTDNGQSQGIYLQDGKLYISAEALSTGLLQDKTGNNYWNLDTGEMSFSGSFELQSGYVRTSIQQISYDVWYVHNDKVYKDSRKNVYGLLIRSNDFGYCALSPAATYPEFVISGYSPTRCMISTKYSYTERVVYTQGHSDGRYESYLIDTDTEKRVVSMYLGVDGINIACSENLNHQRIYLTDQVFLIQGSTNTSRLVSYSSNPNLYWNDNQLAYVSSSSKRYKKNITDKLDDNLDPHKLYDLPVKQFCYKEDARLQYQDTKDQTIIGLIAEDVDAIYPSAVIHDNDGKVESWDERRILPAMLKLVQEQKSKIDELEERITRLEKLLLK